MSPLVGVLILILLGLLGSRFAFDPARAPLGPRLLLSTGLHFLLVGLLLGPLLGLLTDAVIQQLHALLALGLGWIGLLFGLQLDRRQIGQFPVSFLVFAIGQAVLTFLLFAGAGLLGFRLIGRLEPGVDIAILAAACTAAVSTPAGVALISRTFEVKGPLSRLLFYTASLDALVGILALQVTYALHNPSAAAGIGWGMWVAISIGVGIVFAIFFLWLTRPKPQRDELTLLLLGLVVFEGGSALYLGISPLFTAMVTGVIVANLSPSRRRVYSILQGWEKPIYVILLILAGALISLATWLIVPLALGYLLLRGTAKYFAGRAVRGVVRSTVTAPSSIGIGLLPQGGISLAMALSAALTYGAIVGSGAVRTGFGAIVLAVAASELLGPFLTRDLLRSAGEISPRTEQALAEGAD